MGARSRRSRARARNVELATSLGFLLLSAPALRAAPSGRASLQIRVLRAGEPVASLPVTLEREGAGERTTARTDSGGGVTFRQLSPGTYVVSVERHEQKMLVSPEIQAIVIDLEAPSIQTGHFGRSALTREELDRLPHAGTVSTVLETIEPVAVTDRIDVAGIESGRMPLWSARGSSWTQNRILLDGVDVTDPSGGAALLYPDAFFFEEISLASAAHRAEAAGPGAELHLVSRSFPSSLRGSASFRYSGRALQASNIDERLAGLGVEPRELVRYPSGRLEIGAPALYGAVHGFELSSRVPRFEGDERSSLLAATGKLALEPWTFLGMGQRFRRPTFGAAPEVGAGATVAATESFHLAQASVSSGGVVARLGLARGQLDSTFSETASPLRDLATNEIEDAPSLVTDSTRMRVSALATAEWSLSRHLLRVGAEYAYAAEESLARVPGGMERLVVDGKTHAVSIAQGSGEIDVRLDRLALHLQDAFFLDFLGCSWWMSPGLRFDTSLSGAIRWTSVSPNLSGRIALAPATELHFSWGVYPHVLTSRLENAVSGDRSWVWRRWNDEDGDRRVTSEEVGDALRRGGPGLTSVDEDLPRPYTHELSIGVEKRFRRGFLRWSGYHRWEKRLLQTVKVGVAPESYEAFLFTDVGVDGVSGTADDRELTIFDQKDQLGQDRFRLTQPPGLQSFSQGVDLLLGFEHGRLSWRLSGRAYRDVGTASVGNEAVHNDTGVLGNLFHDPNAATNAEGRLFFDRAFTGKLAVTAEAPGELHVGAAIRYWDGQPFARHLFFPELGQGFTIVQAFPRGRLRYTFNMTVDLRLEREFPLGRARLSLAMNAFNLFNQALETEEVVESGERFRDPKAVQPARTLALEARLRF